MLLENAKANALNLRAIGPAVIALRHCAIAVVAAFVLIVLVKRVVCFTLLQRLLISAFPIFTYFPSGGHVMVLLLALAIMLGRL